MTIRIKKQRLVIWMYETNTLAKNCAIRKRVQDANRRLEGFHNRSIVSFKFTKDLSLFLKNGGDRINRIACFKLLGEGVISQADARLDLVVAESRFEEISEGKG